MKEPTTHELITHASEHYGITKLRARELMRIPVHPYELRDDFAGKAMQAMTTDMQRAISIKETARKHGISFSEEVALQSYDIADGMLKERIKISDAGWNG